MTKKFVIFVNVIIILVTFALMLYFNYRKTYGVVAWGDVGRVLVCLIALIIEIIVLIILLSVWRFSDDE